MIVDYAIEGAPIDRGKYHDLGFAFSEIDVRKREKKSKSGKNEGFEIVCDFTGFLINEENDVFTVFPKHFPIQKENLENDSHLLFNVLMKAQNKKPVSMIGLDAKNNFQSDYPFDPFFRVYNYFSEFGLLFEDRKAIKPNQSGRIKWKETISKGEFYVERGKTVLFPFYYERKYNFSTFLTEAMVFVIDYTLMKFKYFIDLSDTGREFPDFDFLGSKEYVVEVLYSYKEMEFKDSKLGLLDALIAFFTQIKVGGNYYLKHYYFNSVWEDMVEEFLNGNFDCFVGGELKLKSNVFKARFKKTTFYPNSLNDSHYFQPDYYFVDDFSNQIIFDAKYYSSMHGMNYKQICYNMFLEGYIGKEYPDNTKSSAVFPNSLLSEMGGYPTSDTSYYGYIERERILNNIVPKYNNVFSALILPSEERKRKRHFQLSSIYAKGDPNLFISEEYFNIKEVMQYYVNKRFVITDDL
ncbi:LlaJI family restriction endonuclease [Enterococcus faecalis]|nr:LlaJI family restriction endonuclease [Enterococcus faecalis]